MAICLVTMGNNAIKTKITPQRANKPANMKQKPTFRQCGMCQQFRECSIYAGVRANGNPCVSYKPKRDQPTT